MKLCVIQTPLGFFAIPWIIAFRLHFVASLRFFWVQFQEGPHLSFVMSVGSMFCWCFAQVVPGCQMTTWPWMQDSTLPYFTYLYLVNVGDSEGSVEDVMFLIGSIWRGKGVASERERSVASKREQRVAPKRGASTQLNNWSGFYLPP